MRKRTGLGMPDQPSLIQHDIMVKVQLTCKCQFAADGACCCKKVQCLTTCEATFGTCSLYACTSTPRRRAYAPTSPSNMQCFFMMCKLCNDDSFLLCKELGCTCVRSTDGVLFMVIDLSCSA